MASKRRIRRRNIANCERKHHYDELAEAELQGRRMRAKHPGELYDPYKCQCGKWVIGHRPKHVNAFITDRQRRKL